MSTYIPSSGDLCVLDGRASSFFLFEAPGVDRNTRADHLGPGIPFAVVEVLFQEAEPGTTKVSNDLFTIKIVSPTVQGWALVRRWWFEQNVIRKLA